MPLTLIQLALVFIGGALGSVLRLAVPFDQLESLWLVNILGTVFLAWVNNSKRFSSAKARAFWATGFAGGFTTMSGIAIFISTAPESPGFAVLQSAAMFAVGIAVYHLAARRFGGVAR